ncbi:Uma2 family endonuclease [Kitasatospora sp. NBC_00240]|uniref:Uma2 family endonuclease n=1 Tax=Kitasatospora sp. NBC_00240 TaxID=2903567 RepID=UPI00224F885D|nr:Uma2 family endonuclease [Kitasatospora sp. NBC_00240]MCX5211653.1 Uma2 family endonuclease [Kitasatospora sp. NBC_00240]
MAEEIVVDLDQALWQVWKSMDVPEGFRAEIIGEAVELSPIGAVRHFTVNRRLRGSLLDHLGGTGHGPASAGNVIHGHKVFVPDVFVAPDDLAEIGDPDGFGVPAAGVALVVETVSPGSESRKRDLVRKHRAYATAGIPVYVIIDDFDDGGSVTVLSGPDPARGSYASSVRTPYGEEAIVPEGPAKGFVIGPDVTGGPR